MVMKPGMGRKSSNKNPPIFSHEFILQNHADIVSCVVMTFLIGLMVQATNPVASLFITLHHNVSGAEPTREIPTGEPFFYQAGWKDGCAVFFYSLVCIVLHAILQEYFLDKISKRFHLSKSKLNLLNESGQLLVFHLVNVFWGGDAILREGFFSNIALLWEGYPEHAMSFLLKLWWVIQGSYWIHTIPELYFQRIKRDEWAPKIIQAIANFAFIAVAYGFKFQRVGVCLVVLHSIGETVAHIARFNSILRGDKEDAVAKSVALVNGVVLVVVRLAAVVLAVLTFWYGLGGLGGVGAPTRAAPPPLALRLGALLTVCALQVYLMFNFITQQMEMRRELKALASANLAKANKAQKKEKPKKEKAKRSSIEESDLPEVDQNTNKTLRTRSSAIKAK